MTLWTSMTLEGWVDVMYAIVDTWGTKWYAAIFVYFYFVSFVKFIKEIPTSRGYLFADLKIARNAILQSPNAQNQGAQPPNHGAQPQNHEAQPLNSEAHPQNKGPRAQIAPKVAEEVKLDCRILNLVAVCTFASCAAQTVSLSEISVDKSVVPLRWRLRSRFLSQAFPTVCAKPTRRHLAFLSWMSLRRRSRSPREALVHAPTPKP